jgi:hypothetical protein
VIRGYFDGSIYYSPTIKLLCLGGVIGPATVMDEFSKRWRATLNEHGVETFHMSDVMAGRGNFDGWHRKRTDELLKALANVFGNFYQRHLRVKSCIIDLDAYDRAKTLFATLKNPEAICVDFCCGSAVPPDESVQADQQYSSIIFCFDQNEEFLKFIYSAWQRRRKAHRGGWPEQVKDIVKGNSAYEPGLQAADLIAWSTNSAYRGIERSYPYAFLNILMGMHKFFDYDNIISGAKDGRLLWRPPALQYWTPFRRKR